MRINHSHEGDLRITAHLHLNLMHEQVMKMVEKNWCDFSMEFAVFFAIFGNLMGFLPSWFLQGGAGRARKFNFERLTLVMRVLPLTNPFFLHMRDTFLGMNALLITSCRFIGHFFNL